MNELAGDGRGAAGVAPGGTGAFVGFRVLLPMAHHDAGRRVVAKADKPPLDEAEAVKQPPTVPEAVKPSLGEAVPGLAQQLEQLEEVCGLDLRIRAHRRQCEQAVGELAREQGKHERAAALRSEVADVVQYIAEHIAEGDLRESFLNHARLC